MSSTKRGGQRSEADDYPTPPWAVHRLLEDPIAKQTLPGGAWLEPGAGDGAIIRAVNEVRSDVIWTAYELRDATRPSLLDAVGPRGRVIIDDYVDPKGEGAALWVPAEVKPFKVALGNPPFWLAQPFIERSLMIAEMVMLLLRLNYVGSKKRHPFMRQYMPDAFVLPDRPPFRGEGTDSIEYAWFGFTGRTDPLTVGAWKMLDITPLAIRRPHSKRGKKKKDAIVEAEGTTEE